MFPENLTSTIPYSPMFKYATFEYSLLQFIALFCFVFFKEKGIKHLTVFSIIHV